MAAYLSIADAYFFEELGARAPGLMRSESVEYKRCPVGSWSSSSSSMSAAKSSRSIARDGVRMVQSPSKAGDFQSSLSGLRRRIRRPHARLVISALELDNSITDTIQEDWSMSKLTEKYGMSAGLLFTDAAHILLDTSSESTSP